jgi:hypothetical protein
MSQWHACDKHFADSMAMTERLGARPFQVQTQVEYGFVLLSRPDGDHARAVELLDRSITGALEMGMTKVAEDARKIRTG